MKAIIHFDGGSRGNPRLAAGAAVIEMDGKTHQVAQRLEYATNNVAEYSGLIIGIEEAIKLGATQLVIKGDSKLVVEQVNRRWRCKESSLIPLRDQAINLLSSVKWSLTWIPRNENSEPDAIANQCMDGKDSTTEANGQAVSAKPKPPAPSPSTHSNPATVSPEVAALNRKGAKAGFKDWVKLKVPNSRDRFSSMKLVALVAEASPEAQQQIKATWLERCRIDKQPEEFSDQDEAKCLRWHLRGLSPDNAVRKVRIDAEISRNCTR